jgi:mono/diheme cytochrome c family protein
MVNGLSSMVSFNFHTFTLQTCFMNSTTLAQIHLVAVQLFVLIYTVKIVLLFANKDALQKFTRVTRLLEMIVNILFLGTGIWLFVILGAIKTMQIVKLVLIFASIPIAVIGFKKMNKGLAVLAFLMIVGAYGIAEMAKKKPFIPNKVIVQGDADERTKMGATTYIANCAMCHGQDGKKMYRDAKDLSTSALNDDAVQLFIRSGSKGRMPAYENVLSADEIAATSAYVMTLRQATAM